MYLVLPRLNVTFDTTFFLSNYFSDRAEILEKTRESFTKRFLAATALESRSDFVITEDPEFKDFKEIKCRRIVDVNI